MLVSLTVGKVDAGVAVLLTEDKRLIEFPSILLPPDISSGSIVDITVSRNHQTESAAQQAFQQLQTKIYQTFGTRSPSAPVLRCRNTTQTSVVLEWDPIELATAELRSLSLYRNGSKAGSIPRPLEQHCTKISGLALDTEYQFHLVLRTSAGTYSSERLVVRTHKMTELGGITVTPGLMPAQLKESLVNTVTGIGAKLIDQVRIDTTHFVCTEGRGPLWEKAVEMNIPVVVPDWVKACEREGRIVGVRQYYINADPRLRQIGPPAGQQQQQQQQQNQATHGRSQSMQQQNQKSPPMPSPQLGITPPTPEQVRKEPPNGNTSATDMVTVAEKDAAEASEGEPPAPPPKDESAAETTTSADDAKDEAKETEQVDPDDTPRAEEAAKGSEDPDSKSKKSEEEVDSAADKRLEAGEPDKDGDVSPSQGSFQDVEL
ncbi:uncharacterized protein J3D65DRAFT_416862 [Phyllosticta citribraziliensis]|uniref:Chitin biosynthesis protein n=1 Tax=Phyllosticta citribraziliensis TaxID=989973 RepID=A0ABR1LMG8_9PEZI